MLRHASILAFAASFAWSADPAPEPVAAGEDLVILTNQHRINGYLLEDGVDSVTIKTIGGTLTIPRRLVAHAEPGFTRRRAELDPDDYAAHIELVRWCLARNRRTDALNVLKAVAKHPDIDLEGLRVLARLTDEIDGPEAALPIYQRYRDAGGQDPSILKRLAQLEGIAEQNEELEQAYQDQLAGRVIQEGLESTRRWSAEDPRWSNRVQTRLVEAPDSGGDRVMRLSFTGDDQDNHKKAAIRWREQLDVRGSNVFYLEASNPQQEPLRISIAVKSGDKWDYYESTPQAVPGGSAWHQLRFDLTNEDFKCAKDNYSSHSHQVGQVDDIREIQIQVHNGRRDGNLFVNNVGFLSSQMAK